MKSRKIVVLMAIIFVWGVVVADNVTAEDKYPLIHENGIKTSINADRTVYINAGWSGYNNLFSIIIKNFGIPHAIHVNPNYFTLVTMDKLSHSYTSSEKLTLQLQPDTTAIGSIVFDGNTSRSIPNYLVYESPATGRIVVNFDY